MVRVAEVGVLVDGDLAVQCHDVAGAGANQRVDLNQGCVFLLEDVPQLQDCRGNLFGQFRGEACCCNDLVGLGLVDANGRVNGDACQCLGALNGELLDFHAAFNRAHGQVVAVGAVQQYGEVELLGNVCALGDHDLVHGVALDVHAENVGCVLECLVGGLCDLDAAGLAAASDLYLGFNNHDAADFLGCGLGFFRSVGNDAGQHGYAVRLEHIARLVFIQVHGLVSFLSKSMLTRRRGKA